MVDVGRNATFRIIICRMENNPKQGHIFIFIFVDQPRGLVVRVSDY